MEQRVSRNIEQRSSFKHALSSIQVPVKLSEGVHVLRVSESGIVRKAFLTLSQDKFTLYITTEKRGLMPPGKGSIFSLRRTKSNGDADDTRERIIDIGAIDRIQRGQVTHKFELAKCVDISISCSRRLTATAGAIYCQCIRTNIPASTETTESHARTHSEIY